MKSKGIEFEPGMSNEQIMESENAFNLTFPNVLKDFLSAGVPVSNGFYNWRDLSAENIALVNKAIKKPYIDILNELKDEGYWCMSWGEKPNEIKEAIERFESMYAASPKIFPIFSHRYLIDLSPEPCVLSIVGTDTICYSNNLEKYLAIEFKIEEFDKSVRCDNIPFCSSLIYD
ncbi:MAG: hypothetical protein RR565_06535 [Erysipelothrix sp.]